ncbi:MAG: phosphatase PAP2 family protein [Chloroflexota bacterium]|nr:phosphatase PAP2 family protein [Chloroflexota bacterium]
MLAALLVECLRGRVRLLPPVIACAIVVAVGFSRIVLGAHFPADVLDGLLAGGAWLSASLVVLYLAERRPALRRRLRRAS